MRSRGRLVAVSVLALAVPSAAMATHHCSSVYRYFQREPLIVVDTRDCAGNDGLASFRPDRVFKVQAGNCRDPDDPEKPMYQVLLRSQMNGTTYDVIWVDSTGMQSIRDQLEENREMGLQRRECNRSGYLSDE